jgi:hypothetical protein
MLAALDGEFAKLYADSGRPSIPPERLLRALLLQTFYTIRSETQLMEQLNYNLLYRPLVCRTGGRRAGVGAEVFTKNRERLFRAPRTARMSRRRAAATANVTSMARRAATIRTLRPPTLRPSSTARAKARCAFRGSRPQIPSEAGRLYRLKPARDSDDPRRLARRFSRRRHHQVSWRARRQACDVWRPRSVVVRAIIES